MSVLDQSDTVLRILWDFCTRPTGIAVLSVLVLSLIFLKLAAQTAKNAYDTFMWFYNIRGGTLVVFGTLAFIVLAGWEGSKTMVYTWMQESNILAWIDGVREYAIVQMHEM